MVEIEPSTIPRRQTRSRHQICPSNSTPLLLDEKNDGSISPQVSASRLGSDLPSRVTLLVPLVYNPQHAAGDEHMAEADDSASDTSEDALPSFLARYVENRRLVLARDHKYTEIKQCTWTPHSDRFATPDAVRRYASISSRLFNDMRVLPLGVSRTLTACSTTG